MKQGNLSALWQAVIISRQVEAVFVICINHIREAVHTIVVHHIAINRPAVLPRVVQVTLVLAVGTVINQIQRTSHHIAVAPRKVQRQRRVHMILMMTAMTIYIDGDYDYDRYDRDSDYADGVDDAIDEYGEDY